eukprot:4761995-Pleurochrysis_carterae.AAC.2
MEPGDDAGRVGVSGAGSSEESSPMPTFELIDEEFNLRTLQEEHPELADVADVGRESRRVHEEFSYRHYIHPSGNCRYFATGKRKPPGGSSEEPTRNGWLNYKSAGDGGSLNERNRTKPYQRKHQLHEGILRVSGSLVDDVGIQVSIGEYTVVALEGHPCWDALGPELYTARQKHKFKYLAQNREEQVWLVFSQRKQSRTDAQYAAIEKRVKRMEEKAEEHSRQIIELSDQVEHLDIHSQPQRSERQTPSKQTAHKAYGDWKNESVGSFFPIDSSRNGGKGQVTIDDVQRYFYDYCSKVLADVHGGFKLKGRFQRDKDGNLAELKVPYLVLCSAKRPPVEELRITLKDVKRHWSHLSDAQLTVLHPKYKSHSMERITRLKFMSIAAMMLIMEGYIDDNGNPQGRPVTAPVPIEMVSTRAGTSS